MPDASAFTDPEGFAAAPAVGAGDADEIDAALERLLDDGRNGEEGGQGLSSAARDLDASGAPGSPGRAAHDVCSAPAAGEPQDRFEAAAWAALLQPRGRSC